MKLLSHYIDAQKASLPQIVNWREYYLNDSLFYSHRATHYDRDTYPSRLHYHEYYELVIVVKGDIHYICGSETNQPQPGDILLIPPGMLHMSRINADAVDYDRHVFYLYPDAFDTVGCGALSNFLKDSDRPCLTRPDPQTLSELFRLLEQLDTALSSREDPLAQALAIGCVIQIFYLLNRAGQKILSGPRRLPEPLATVQQYLDSHYMELHSVEQAAKHFFYSREYLSRLFKAHFNISVADYIRLRRVAASQTLISHGLPIGQICYQVGFENPSTFIRAFRAVTGMTPSAYRQAASQSKGNACQEADPDVQ